MKLKCWITVIGLSLSISVTAADESPKVGIRAPGFIGKTAKGEAVGLSDYRGKVVLLDFWASWCGPCREEMPFLVEFYREYQEKAFQVIAVNIDNSVDNMEKFLSKLYDRPGFPIVVDREKAIPRLYEIETMPTSIFIDKEGTIRFWHNGFKTSYKKRFREELEELLSEK